MQATAGSAESARISRWTPTLDPAPPLWVASIRPQHNKVAETFQQPTRGGVKSLYKHSRCWMLLACLALLLFASCSSQTPEWTVHGSTRVCVCVHSGSPYQSDYFMQIFVRLPDTQSKSQSHCTGNGGQLVCQRVLSQSKEPASATIAVITLSALWEGGGRTVAAPHLPENVTQIELLSLSDKAFSY